MKNKFLLSGIAALALAASASAQVVVNVTGANAFRSAAVDTIIASYGAGLTGVAHTGTAGTLASLRGATRSIFRGTFPGSGDTIIRCTWTGSVEGIRDVAVPQNQTFLPQSALTGSGTSYTGPNSVTAYHTSTASTQSAAAKFAFSDVYPTTSPYDVSGLTDTVVGVIVFVPVANAGVSANLTNITSQQFKALWGSGFQKVSLLTGVATDTNNIYATGRHDLSGTRSTYLAESGYGVATPVNQWKPTVSGLTISTLQNWPVGDGINASGVWNGDIAGNGGFQSGNSIAAAMQATTNAVQLKNAAGTNIGSPVAVNIITVTSLNDALTAVTGASGAPAKALSYNGVGVTPANPLSAADTAKVARGAYTMWGYEHLMYSGDLSAVQNQAFFDQMTGNIATNLGTSGIPITSMFVSRGDDGGLVAP